jgi:hypothetical protein
METSSCKFGVGHHANALQETTKSTKVKTFIDKGKAVVGN